MTSRDDRVQCGVEIPIETKQAMKDADSPMWKLVDEGVRMVLGLDEGSTEAAVEQRLKEVRQERQELGDQLDEIQNRVGELEEMETDLESKLSDIRDRKQSHNDRLSRILDQMLSDDRNRPVLAWMSEVKEASVHEYGSQSRENIRRVVEDLRTLATEEGYAINPSRLSRSPDASSQPAATDGGTDDEWAYLSGDASDE